MKQSVSHYVMPDEKKKQRRNWCTAWGWTALKTLFTVMNRHPIFSHRSRWGRICAFGRGGWIFTWEIRSAVKNSSPMKKPLPLTMVPPTRTAGLKKYGKISARAGGKAGVPCVACGGLYSGRSMDTAVLLHFEGRSSGNGGYLQCRFRRSA